MERTHYGTEWEHHIVDHTYADDGFGNLLTTDLDVFFFNIDQIWIEEH